MDLASISRISTQKEKGSAYCALLGTVISKSTSPSVQEVENILTAAVSETPVVARQVLSELVKLLKEKAGQIDVLQEILQRSLAIVTPRGVTFDEQVHVRSSGLHVDMLRSKSPSADYFVGKFFLWNIRRT